MKLWVIVADNIDYGSGGTWVVGVFDSEDTANEAAKNDKKLYMKNEGKHAIYNVDIFETELNTIVEMDYN